MKNLLKYSVYFILSLFLHAAAFGQVVEHNTKIKDGSIGNTTSTPSTNAILELESNAKGFLLPRMNNAERDAIPLSSRAEGNGLTIYNTDTNCLNYWNVNNDIWMSLCGTLPPSVLTIDPASICNKITLKTADKKDKLKQGQYLTPDDILYIDINVGTAGTYDISAVTENGYYFSATGTFMNTGIIRVALRGTGVPIKGYTAANDGDNVSFYLNGKSLGNLCSSFKIPVELDGTQFSINCNSNYTAVGNYFLGVPVDPLKNYIDVKVNVTAKGNYRISTTTANGVSFSSTGSFNTVGNDQTVRLYAEGTPNMAGATQVTTSTNSNGGANTTCTIKFTVKDVDYKVDLTKSKHSGEYINGRQLIPNNTLTIEVEVLAPGKVSFELKSGTVIFKANNVVLNYVEGKENKQFVTLMNNAVALPETGDKLTFVGTGKYSGTYNIDVTSAAVDYLIDCSSIVVNNKKPYVPQTAVGAEHFIKLKVNVIKPGNYEISTNTINGVSFKASGYFDTAENGKEIQLMATGTPLFKQDNVQYVLKTNAVSNTSNKCSFNISIAHPSRSFNILVLGKEEYGPGYPSGAAYRLLNNPENFGENGKVRAGKINVSTYHKLSITTYESSLELSRMIRSQDIDIILIVQGGAVTEEGTGFLREFFDNGGVVILSNQINIYSAQVFNRFLEPGYTDFFGMYSGSGAVTFRSDFGNTNSPFGSVSGKKIINFTDKFKYLNNLSDKYYDLLVPSSARPNDYLVVKHKKKGYMYIGFGGWMASTDGRKRIGPVEATMDGEPEETLFAGQRVNNAQFFLKVMEWAFNYSTENKK